MTVFSTASCKRSSENTIGVALYKFDDTFMSSVRRSIEAQAQGKIALNIVDSQNQQAAQNDQIDTFLTQKFKAIAINLVARTAAGVIVDRAKAAGVPLVFFNREPLPEDMKKWGKVYDVGAKASSTAPCRSKLPRNTGSPIQRQTRTASC